LSVGECMPYTAGRALPTFAEDLAKRTQGEKTAKLKESPRSSAIVEKSANGPRKFLGKKKTKCWSLRRGKEGTTLRAEISDAKGETENLIRAPRKTNRLP